MRFFLVTKRYTCGQGRAWWFEIVQPWTLLFAVPFVQTSSNIRFGFPSTKSPMKCVLVSFNCLVWNLDLPIQSKPRSTHIMLAELIPKSEVSKRNPRYYQGLPPSGSPYCLNLMKRLTYSTHGFWDSVEAIERMKYFTEQALTWGREDSTLKVILGFPHVIILVKVRGASYIDSKWKNILGSMLLYIHTYIHTCMHAYIPTYLPTYVRTYRQTDRQTDRPTDIQTDRQTDIQTYWHQDRQSLSLSLW